MKLALVRFLVPTVKKIIKQYRSKGVSSKRGIREFGSRNEFAKHEAKLVVESMFGAAFGEKSGGVTPLFEPYIASFCSHIEDDEYVRENGLLSMWRGYGAEGGVALVFDTKALSEYLEREQEEFWYSFGTFGDVVYEGDQKSFDCEFSDFLDLVPGVLNAVLHPEQFDINENFLNHFLRSITRFKHRAFSEEREVRIVAIPWTQRSFESEAKTPTVNIAERKKKKLRWRTRDGEKIRYLSLFDGESVSHLPIVKIIIGPHRDQQGRRKEIMRTVGRRHDIEIRSSETPYINF